jgi:Holliday junction resolvasome RuvABC endonuclease subunit
MTKILSFDLSTVSTGFALIYNGKIIQDAYGTISPPKKLKGGAKLVFFQDEIRKIIKKLKPDLVCIESIFKGPGLIAYKSLSMHRGVVVKTIYEETGKDPCSILAVEARATLDLSTSKDDAFKEAIKKYKLKGFDFIKDNDIIDAFILGVAVEKLLKSGVKETILQVENKPKKKKKSKK